MVDGRVVIAGGGIGGLALAMGLAQRGVASIVLEKAAHLGEIGAGIQLGPNAFHAFDRLGVGAAARDLAIYVEDLRLMDAMTADEICRIPLGEGFRAHFGNPYAVVHRGELHGIFLRACEAHDLVDLRTGAAVTGYEQGAKTCAALLDSGERVEGAALIGADGLWSRVRAQMLGDVPPRVSGHSSYRSVIPVEAMPKDLRWNAACLWAGPKCHLVHYPLSDWTAFNLVVTYHNDAPAPVAGQPVAHEEVRKGFTHIHPRAQEIIEIGRDWKLWVLCDRNPVRRWCEGRVALLGDAAHPMMQYMAQGACMALEDAVVLSDCLAENPVPEALQAYESKRYQRTARVQLQSRAMGDHVYHPEGAHADLRDSLMQAKSTADWYAALGWLYGARV